MRDIAIEHHANQPVVFQDEPAIDAARGVAQHDLLLDPPPSEKSPAENRLMPVTFSLVAVAIGLKAASIGA